MIPLPHSLVGVGKYFMPPQKIKYWVLLLVLCKTMTADRYLNITRVILWLLVISTMNKQHKAQPFTFQNIKYKNSIKRPIIFWGLCIICPTSWCKGSKHTYLWDFYLGFNYQPVFKLCDWYFVVWVVFASQNATSLGWTLIQVFFVW